MAIAVSDKTLEDNLNLIFINRAVPQTHSSWVAMKELAGTDIRFGDKEINFRFSDDGKRLGECMSVYVVDKEGKRVGVYEYYTQNDGRYCNGVCAHLINQETQEKIKPGYLLGA